MGEFRHQQIQAPLAAAISMKSDEQKYLVTSPQACSLREAEKEITVLKGATQFWLY